MEGAIAAGFALTFSQDCMVYDRRTDGHDYFVYMTMRECGGRPKNAKKVHLLFSV